MAHARQQIREAVATLVTGLTTTGSNVYQSRVYPVQDSNLPCLMVSTLQDEVMEHYDGTKQVRELVVTISGHVKASTDMDDTLDDIAEQVESALYGDQELSGLAKFGGLMSANIELSGEAESPVGVVEMEFKYIYSINGTTPGTLI